MIKIINESIRSFRDELKTKELIVFGAGTRIERVKRIIPSNIPRHIVDNNCELWGKRIKWSRDKEVTIISFNNLARFMKNESNDKFIFLITTAFYSMDIVSQLDGDECFDGIKCYIYNLLADNIEEKSFAFTKGTDQIPRVIHYCWFGDKKMPEIYKKYIETWREKCPDFEIKLWNEKNYDITKNKYMYQAYTEKKFGFVPDYARLDIIYNEGGIYLDTDIELINNITDLLKDRMFCCFMNNFSISLGLGFGAIKHNKLIGEMRDYYDNCSFVNRDGSLNLRPCTEYQDSVLAEFGFRFDNDYQNIQGHVSYPAGLILARDGSNLQKKMHYTKGIHYGSASWADDKAIKARYKFKEFIEARIM